jgi:hypothetical protein
VTFRVARKLVQALPLLVAAASFSAFAQEPRTSAPTVTRLVKLFLEKEATLGAFVREGNGAALETLLTDDFELRIGARTAHPIPRGDWVRELTRTREPGGEIKGMAVHDLGGVMVASFTQQGARGPMMVVDVWRGQGNDWKLAIRYAAPAGSPDFPIPGAGAQEPEIPKKY